jgi:hypothetical protein
MIMLEKISKLDSAVLRALLVAFVGLVGAILRAFGVGSEMFDKSAMELVDQVMLFITACAVLYAAYARISKPNPPLSDRAVTETQRLVDEGKLTPTSGGEEKE